MRVEKETSIVNILGLSMEDYIDLRVILDIRKRDLEESIKEDEAHEGFEEFVVKDKNELQKVNDLIKKLS